MKNEKFKLKAVGLIFLPLFLFAEINNDFYNTAKTGWFFNENNETNETNKTKEANINPFDLKEIMKLPDDKFMRSIPVNNLDMYSADAFQKVFKRAKGIAVMHPTRENVYVVKKMQKFMTDQASKFARVWYVETIQHENELGYPEIKATSFAKTTAYYRKKEEIEKFFKKHIDDLGFVVFYNPKDKMANTREKWTIEGFKKKYGNYDFVWVDVTKRPDLVKKFNIKELPDNFFVYKNKKGEGVWIRIKAGLPTESELVNNTIFMFKNIIDKKDK